MKKAALLSFFLFFLICYHPQQQATAQQQCNAAGGTCYENMILCPSNYTELALYNDCGTSVDGTPKICCKLGTPNCKAEYATCNIPTECCSQICEFDSHRGERICIRIGPTPTIDPLGITCDYSKGINTALGCIPVDSLSGFIKWFLSKIIFVATGVAFLLMAFGAIQILTSAGDPKKLQAGQELITSALSGLLFIILSLFLLRLIGVEILRIPGFGN